MTQTLATTTHVTDTVEGPVFWVTLNQPQKRDAVSLQARQQIPHLICEAEQTPKSEPSYCAALETKPSPPERTSQSSPSYASMLNKPPSRMMRTTALRPQS